MLILHHQPQLKVTTQNKVQERLAKNMEREHQEGVSTMALPALPGAPTLAGEDAVDVSRARSVASVITGNQTPVPAAMPSQEIKHITLANKTNV